MKIERVWAMPNRWTFTIKPIRELLERYVSNGEGWVDPFAGLNSPAEITNDLNPDMPTKYHMHSLDFCQLLKGKCEGILFDPPYSTRQIVECYGKMGLCIRRKEDKHAFFDREKNILYNKVKIGGLTISFGWSTVGFGITRGFEIMEILLVCHGGHHNDTIVTVEKKLREGGATKLIAKEELIGNVKWDTFGRIILK